MFLQTHQLDAWGGGYRLTQLPAAGSILDQDARDLHAFAVIRDTLAEAPPPARDPMSELRTYHTQHTRRPDHG